MTDLEMTKLCAEAVGFRFRNASGAWDAKDGYEAYAPLHDDAQAMALLLWLKPASFHYNVYAGKWSIHTLRDNETGAAFEAFNADPLRAIVECVAKMQSASLTSEVRKSENDVRSQRNIGQDQ